MRSVDWQDDHIVIVDQTRLPDEVRFLHLRTVDELIAAIRRLAVRGAPAIGVAGALGVALAAGDAGNDAEVREQAHRIRASRPTAVNLTWAVDRVLARLPEGRGAVVAEAVALIEEDIATNRALGQRGADWIRSVVAPGPLGIQTHCNAGALACVDWGTALGIVRALHERGAVREVLVDETRPLLQGSRLTAFELAQLGIPYRVQVDGAGASTIARGMVDVVIVGADRIAANGDVANKIGTYPLALAAARAAVPFVVAAPESTIDLGTASGDDVVVEEREGAEVVSLAAPTGARGYNPAFDVTPRDLVTAIVTEARVVQPALGESLERQGVRSGT